jgi:tetratricopeptide (TPR) repeat protein
MFFNRKLSSFLLLAVLITLGPISARANSLSPALAKQLNATAKLIAEDKLDTARGKLNSLATSFTSPLAQAFINRSIAYLELAKNNYPAAIKYFEKSADSNQLSTAMHDNAVLNLSQLLLAVGRYDDAISRMTAWFSRNTGTATAHIVFANALARRERHKEAIPHARKAIELAPETDENYYRLLLALLYETKDYSECAATLESMIRLFPAVDNYWTQLASIYLTLNDYRKAQAILETANYKKLLKEENDLLLLVKLHLYTDVPLKAAKLLNSLLEQKQVPDTWKNRELLASAWLQARETNKAITELEIAAKQSPDGKLYDKLARLYAHAEKWKRARMSAKKALNKGSIDTAGSLYLLLSHAAEQDKDIPAAISAATSALDYESSKEQADNWLNYLRRLPSTSS